MEFNLALCYVIIRFLLPLILGSAVFFRQNVFSGIYLILLLVGPILPTPRANSVLKGGHGIYIKLIIAMSLIISCAHIIFQIVLFSVFSQYSNSIDYCSTIGKVYNLIGLHRYNDISVWNVLRLTGIDFMVLISSGLIHIITKKAYTHHIEQEKEREELAKEQETKRMERMERRERRLTEAGLSTVSMPMNSKTIQEKYKKRMKKQRASEWAYYITETIFLVLLCCAGILKPSASASLYFIYFLLIATSLSCNHKFRVFYHYFRVFIAIFAALHFLALFIYQMEYFRPFLPPDDIKVRIIGLVDYVSINCTTVRELHYRDFHWAIYIHPFVLLLLYFLSATLVRITLFRKSFVLDASETCNATVAASVSQRPCEVRSDTLSPPSYASGWMRNSSVRSNVRPNSYENVSASNTEIDGDPHPLDVEHLNQITQISTDSTPLLNDDHMAKNYHSTDRSKVTGNHKGGIEMDVNGSIIWKPETEISNYSSVSGVGIGQSASRPESPTTPGPPPDASRAIISPLIQILKLIRRGSYVGTLIVMMAWSITYHSWTSFLFLLWSCVIWMVPSSRKACLSSSPALVIYAVLLLIGQYVYSLDLTKGELPEEIGSVSMSEIGFRKYYDLSYQPLFIKVLYTIMFWITLRQYIEERERERRRQVVHGVTIEPFNITYGTGQAGEPRRDIRRQMSLATTTGTQQSPFVQFLYDLFKEMLIKYWIWVVAAMLMVMSLSGDRVTIFRIVYMFLFLTFVLTFQFSYKSWRRFMYPFWLIVIVYSMIILTTIYTYQFNNFPDYWQNYLKIRKELQSDIGLVVYDHDAWVLFKELFTPTFFLIITIIQVHFLHKDFLEFSNWDKQTLSPTSTIERSSEMPPSVVPNDIKVEIEMKSDASSFSSKSASKSNKSPPNTVKSNNPKSSESSSFVTPHEQMSPKIKFQEQSGVEEHSLKHNETSIEEIKAIIIKVWAYLKPILEMLIEIIWRLLEMHIIKIILYCAIIIAIGDLSAMNILYVVLISIAMAFTRFEGIVSYALGIWTALLIILKMIFQLRAAQDIAWFRNCSEITSSNDVIFNQTIDNRIYIGFKVTDNIYNYISAYLILILILTFNTVIIIRQRVTRFKKNERPPNDGIVFRKIVRGDADRGFKELIMYFINFWFYKFGVEMCLILLTISIGSRTDVFSVIYALWLFRLVLSDRTTVARIWPIFVGFLGFVLPLQYILCLGIPPGLCIEYPWDTISLNADLREWLFLPDFLVPPSVNKLYLDFFIFLLSCRQLLWFRVEHDTYAGGSNTEAHLEPVEHRRVIPDFFAFGSTTLDFIKSLFFYTFFWITLAIVFLAGTTRVSLFALGYVLGCFIFLWNGNEFYLKPINMVFRLWKALICYTTMIIGCVYFSSLPNFCWVVQLLGIACLNKSRDNNDYQTCNVPYDEAGLLWDGICLTFLIIQKRIFCSYYFYNLIKEIKAQQVLASRGAELIHEIQAKEVSDQEQGEREVMEKIKLKMDRIKAAQQKRFADKAKSIKYHKQDEEYGYDVSPYSTAEGTLTHTPEPEEQLSHTLPTVYSPTPSLPTIMSPQSATTSQPGYLEVYRVGRIRSIDARSSTIPSFSMSLKSSLTEGSFPIASPPPYACVGAPYGTFTAVQYTTATIERRPDTLSLAESSTRTQIPRHVELFESFPPSRTHSIKRKSSVLSIVASHGSSVRSGGYYMFEDPESEFVDLNDKPRKSLIPDPEGDELRRIAKAKGLTAFCSNIMKRASVETEAETEARIFSGESSDVGESSHDSAIVSADRERPDPDASARTTLTSLPSTSTVSQPTIRSVRPSALIAPADDDGDEPHDRGSKDEGHDQEPEEMSHDGSKISLFSRVKGWFKIIKNFIESCIISATAKLNSLSRDYRYVAKRLKVEKRYLKKLFQIEESEGSRYEFMDEAWKRRTLAKISHVSVPKLSKSFDSVDDSVIRKKSNDVHSESTKKPVASDDARLTLDAELEDKTYVKSNLIMRFLYSIFYSILSRSEVMCYIMIVLNQLSSASVLSLPLPLLAFLWGSLSMPRPPKAFWITIITYTEVIVVIKYIFQFNFWPWNASGKIEISPFYAPRILGIEKVNNYANYDLALLLVLFFHRFMLKSLGLWDLSETFESNEKDAVVSVDCDAIKASQNGNETDGQIIFKKDKKHKDKKETVALLYDTSVDVEIPPEDKPKDISDEFESEITPSDQLTEEVTEGLNAMYGIIRAPANLKSGFNKITKPFIRFFKNVLHPPYRITKDVYTLMFLCDFINFFILVFGFYAFGSGYGDGDGYGGVTSFLEENKIPIPFLVTLLLLFALIIIDRALYLRKHIKGKLIFQILLVILIHGWLFFALPGMTDRPFNDPLSSNWPPKLWYIFKCMYFLLSAYQIRSGYPTRILGNCFCKNYGLVNWYLFKGYMVIPFLYDLRMYMDWIWTDTSLVLDEWSLMEDIFVNLYERKCQLHLDEEFPEPRGKAKIRIWKYLLGGAWVCLIIGLIWGPLGLFALGRAVGSANRPIGVTVEMEFSGYQPIFRMNIAAENLDKGLDPIDKFWWDQLKENFSTNAAAQTFLGGYDEEDVTIVDLNGNSTATWGISAPSQKELENELRGDSPIVVKLTYYVTRKKQRKTQDIELTISNENTITLSPVHDKELRQRIAQMLSVEEENKTAILPFIFPNYIRVPEKGQPTVINQLNFMKKEPRNQPKDTKDIEKYRYRSVGIFLQKDQNGSMSSWWEVHDQCEDAQLKNLDSFMQEYLKQHKCRYLPIVLFNDKVFIGVLAFLSGYGIIGIYTTFVFLVSRWVRGLNSESSFKVIYTQMPYVDRVLQLCLDIYLVRESGEFVLEEDLYAKLIFLYRSPETLIKWTKPLEELPAIEQQKSRVESGHGDV